MTSPIEPGAEPTAASASGLAAERTALAWSRSGLAIVGCLAVLARRFVPLDTNANHVGAFVVLAAGGLSWAAALAMSRRGAGTLDPSAGAQQGQLRLVALSTTAVALGAFLLGLFPPH